MNTETKHTPGPFTHESGWIIDGDGKPVAQVAHPKYVPIVTAAPDLLAALKALVVAQADGDPDWSIAHHAIAKAEGHKKVRHGMCPVCGHYGEDCTGAEQEAGK